MPIGQSNLPRKVQQIEEFQAQEWYNSIANDASGVGYINTVTRYNQFPTACPMGCKTGRHGTCTHGYRSYPAVLIKLNGRG